MDFLTYLRQKEILSSQESAPTKTSFFNSPVIVGAAKKVPSLMDSLGRGTINLTKNFIKDPTGTAAKGVNAVGNFVLNSKTFQQMLDDQAKASKTRQTGDDIDVFAKPAVGFAKFLLQEIAAGTLSIGKSIDQASGLKGLRDSVMPKNTGTSKKAEEFIFGREVKSIQDAYVNPTLKFADNKGSGAFEKGLLGVGATIAGGFVESPIGAPAKKILTPQIKSFVKQVISDSKFGRDTIEVGLRDLGLSEDVSREVNDSVKMILEQDWKQGKKSSRIQALVDNAVRQSRAVPVGPTKSVVQVVGKEGDNVFYEVTPQDLKVLSEDLIDGTGRGVAGKTINGKIFHLTAKTPTQMMESAGFKDGGKKSLDEIIEMITPKKRVAIRTEDGRFAGSFMDAQPAYKIAAKQTADEKAIADQARAISRKSIDGIGDFDLTIPEARNTFRNLFTDKEIGFIIRDELIDGKASGRFSRGFRGVVEVVAKDGKVQSGTVNHEGFHAYFNTFIDEAERRVILDKVKSSILTGPSRGVKALNGYKTADARAEEWLADDFARYVREISQNKKPTSPFAEFWSKVLRQVRQWIRKTNDFDKIYKDIIERRRTTFVEKRPMKEAKYNQSGKKPEPTRKEEAEISPKKDLPQQAYEDILTQLSAAERGERVGRSNPDGTFAGYGAKRSTFPDWLPENLRSRELFDKYMDTHVGDMANDFKVTYKKGTKLEQLDNIIRQRIFEKTGEDFRLIPDDLAYIDDLARQFENEIDDLTGETLQKGSSDLDPLVSGQTQKSQIVPQTTQSVSKGGSLPTVYPQEAKRAIVQMAQRNGDSVKKTVQLLSGLKRLKTNVLEYVQNTDERVRQLMDRPDFTVADESNIYQKATLASGRMGARIEAMKKEAKNILEDIRDTAKVTGQEYEALKGEVDDYLIARHAPERNAAIGEKAAGITTEEAEALIKKIEAGPHGKDVVRLADQIQEMNNKTLDLLLKSQVIAPELHTLLRDRYKYHVPLYRIQEAEGDIGGLLTGKGFDVRSTGIKRAKGSEKEIDDIIGNVVYNYEQAIIRSEKNTVDLATLQFVRDNKDALKGLMKEMKPKMVGKTFDDVPIMERTDDPKILQLRENGKPVWIRVEDANLAVAIRGLGREKLGGILNAVRAFTNFYSGLHTRFNPDFALPNKIRDLQETITYLAAQKDIKGSAVAKVAIKDPVSIKGVIDALRGKDTEGARLYREMKAAGGTTGGMGLSTREQVGIDMDKLDKLVTSKTRQVAENLVEYVDNWNTIFEDSTRLTVYRTAREQGLSIDRAAFLAKEASINFNRMGKGGPVINAIWMFSNASIQGSTKMLRALKNPKVLAGVVTTVGVAVAATNEWNDSVDPDWREKVPKWDRMNSLPVVLPTENGEFKYMVLPVSWGLKPIKVMTDYAYDAVSGYGSSAEEIMKGTLTAIIEGYNPVGGTDLNSALMPTILDTPYEIARNQKWSGSKITPTNYNNAPDDTLYFSSLPETSTGRAAISISELLAEGGIEVSPANIKYAYESYIGGAGRFVSKLYNTVAGAVENKPLALDEYPFVARFYRERSNDEVEYTQSTETDELDSLKDEDARTKKKASIEAIALKDEIMALQTSEEKKARLRELAAENPDIVEKVLDLIEDEKAGLTPQESQLKNATVAVRAEYIKKQLDKLETSEEKRAYLKELQAKKILTESVMDELGL